MKANEKLIQNGIDIIGDIHGHELELRAMLEKLGYREKDEVFSHPAGRKALFLGDFIDRGPRILEVLQIVRRMVEAETALAIMGNHELNALRYHTKGRDGAPLRDHSDSNTHQHQKTLDQIPAKQMDDWLEWFAGLPLWLELGGLRAVHACWDDAALAELRGIELLDRAVLEKYSRKGTAEYDIISTIMNGPEGVFPDGHVHTTADGKTRADFRVRWWEDLRGKTCREAIFPANPETPSCMPAFMPSTIPYPETACPVFFGHYAIAHEPLPSPVTCNVACVDYGIGKGGYLAAYRWDGEAKLEPGNFITAHQGNHANRKKHQ